jgi:signal transduction histidine kinase
MDVENEAARLKALRHYEILDTPAEAAFDRLSRIASLIFETPIALVSLIDKDRQWFKSRVGIEVTETTREWAFCDHAIRNATEPLIVRDATLDERFRDNPLVTSEPEIRFYIGAPIVTRDGHALGTVCAIDNRPRFDIERRHVELLKTLAEIAVEEMEVRLALKSLDLEKRLKERAMEEALRAEKARRKAEADMLRMRSHETLGRLTGGIAHEFNNLFAGLMLSAELVRDSAGPGFAAARSIDTIMTSVERGAELTGHLMSYSGKQFLRPQRTNVAAFLKEARELLLVGKEDRLAIKVEAEENLPEVEIDREMSLAALSELVENAIEASTTDMAHVSISASVASLTFGEVSGGSPAEKFLRIVIADKGRGMSEEVLRRATEPFFTTKPVGQGPGLGLSMAYGFVQQSGGFARVESTPGHGTSISAFLPLPKE